MTDSPIRLGIPKPVRPPKVRKPLLRKKPLAPYRPDRVFIQNTTPEKLEAVSALLFPKPRPRQRVPKPLKRSTSPIARKTPLKRSLKRIKPRRKDPKMQAWHDAVRARALYTDREGVTRYCCFHCRHGFEKKTDVIGDHFPHPRSTHPERKYDLDNGVCSCHRCNDKYSPCRAQSLERWKRAQELGVTFLAVHTPSEYVEHAPAV